VARRIIDMATPRMYTKHSPFYMVAAILYALWSVIGAAPLSERPHKSTEDVWE
jgi:hypothetical protein